MKRILSVCAMVLLLCLTSACQDKAAINELEGFRTQSAIEAQNEAAVRRQMAEFNKQNMDIGDVMNTPDYKLHFPIQSEPKNTSQHREVLETFWGAFPDMTHTLDKLSSSGDTVTAIYTIRASHSGEFMGIPGTGKQIEEPVIGIWRFSDGKIAEFWGVLDMASLMQQLGMELKPGEPAT